MGARHSNDKSVPSFDYKHRFPYNKQCSIEGGPIPILPMDLSCIDVSIPCSGMGCPNIELMKISFISGLPNPGISSYRPESYEVPNIDSKCTLPRFVPSGQYSFIRLTSQFTKNHLINTSEVETNLNHLLSLYLNKIDPETFPSFIGVLKTPAEFSISYQRLHVLACRLIYHQIMCKNKMLYFGSPVIMTHEGDEFALIQHPSFSSALFPSSIMEVKLFPHYPLKFLHSLNITSYELRLSPLDLVRSAFSFHRYPPPPLKKGFYDHFSNFFPDSTRVAMPFSLLYLDSLSDQSIHTLYSFILHHMFARNTGSTAYNPDAPIIVVMTNATFLDHEICINKSTVLEIFENYLSITPQIYLAPLCPPQQSKALQYCDFIPNVYPDTHYFDTPCDAASNFPSHPKPKSVVSFSSEDFQRSCDDWIQLLNTALLQGITPLLLKSLVSKSKPTLSNANSIPLCNPSKFLSLLPFAKATYPAFIQQFQWHNLQKSGAQVIQLSISTHYVRNSFTLDKNALPSKSTSYETPFIKAVRSINFSHRELDVCAEYLVDVQNLPECLPVNSYTPVQPRVNDINTTPLQTSSSHVKMFAPFESQLEQTQISEQTILDHLDEDYRYSLTHIPISNGTVSDGGVATSDSSFCSKKNEEANSGIDRGIDIGCESDSNNHGTCHTPNIEPIVLIESRGKPQSYTFNYRGEHNSYLNKPYTTNIDYFTSSQSTDIEIKITSPDFSHPTHANRVTSLPIPLPRDISAAHCALPMNQVLAIDTYLSNMTPQVKKQSRYLVQLTHRFSQIESGDEKPFPMIPYFHPYMCPAICMMSSYNPIASNFGSIEVEIGDFNSSREALLHLNINIPLFLILTLPEDFDIQFCKLPSVSKYTEPLYGWDFDCTPHFGKKDSSDNKEPHSQDDIEFHRNMILQRIKHLARFLTEPPLSSLDNSPFTQRTVYYWVVKGISGYFECLPRINQCALAHFFSLGMQPQ